MLRTIVKATVTRKPGESKAHYYNRINRKVRKIKSDIIACIVAVLMMIGIMLLFLFGGSNGQCNYSKCNCNIPGYTNAWHCEQHGHECPQND